MDANKTGAFIAALRKEQGLTQTALAEKLNINNRTVSKWENGDGYPDITLLPVLAETLGVTTDELLRGEPAPKPTEEAPEVFFELEYMKRARYMNESVRAVCSQKLPVAIQRILMAALLVFAFSFCNVLLPTKNTPLFNGLFTALLAAYLLLWLLMAQTGRRGIRMLKIRNGGVQPPSRYVFADRIYTYNGTFREEYRYEDITAFLISRNVYTVMLFKRLMLTVPRKELGDRQEAFEAFMRGKAPTTVVIKTPLRMKILGGVVVLLTVLLVLSSVWTLYERSERFFYHDMDTKSHYFYQFEKEFNQGVANIRADKKIMAEAKQDGYTAYWAEDYLNLENISDAEITPTSVTFDSYNGALYYSGYIYYEGEGLPWITLMSFDDNLVDKQEHYIKADGLYLYGREKNGSLSGKPWYLVKPLSENWYYVELHCDEGE